MKKALSVMLTLTLLLCCMPALAEETEYIPYTEPTGQFSLEYPADYLLLDDETVDALFSAVEDEEIDFGFDFSTYAAAIRESNTVYFLNLLNGSNFNVVFQDLGGHLSANLMMLMIYPSLVEQYKTIFPTAVFDDEGSILTVNGVDFVRLALRYLQDDVTVHMEQYGVCMGNFLYYFTFSSDNTIKEADVTHILSTFSSTAE